MGFDGAGIATQASYSAVVMPAYPNMFVGTVEPDYGWIGNFKHGDTLTVTAYKRTPDVVPPNTGPPHDFLYWEVHTWRDDIPVIQYDNPLKIKMEDMGSYGAMVIPHFAASASQIPVTSKILNTYGKILTTLIVANLPYGI